MADNQIQGIMDVTLEKVRALADAETIIGERMDLGNGISVVPISKLTLGFASGGSDFPSRTDRGLFGGGGGAGMSITPVAFLVVKGDHVSLLQISKDTDAVSKAIGLVPDVFDKITGLFKKDK